MTTIGVLALQGAFAKHLQMLQNIGVKSIEVRTPADLSQCDGLIIPGGESTTIQKQIDFIDLRNPIQEFLKTKPIFGTCAGIILMASTVHDPNIQPFSCLDIEVERNAFGRQIDSFSTSIQFDQKDFRAVFIRAPRILKCGADVKVLSTYAGEPIIVRQNHFLGATFHPELTNDPNIHRYFLKMCA